MITVERDMEFLVFKKDGNEIYDIDLDGYNGFDSVSDCLATKQWATPEVKEQVEKLI